MNANVLELLKQDHREVISLVQQALIERDRGRLVELCHRLIAELNRHDEAEETVFYPACINAGLEHIVKDFFDDHRRVTEQVMQLDRLNELSALHDILLVLQRYLEMHIQREESALFPEVAQIMSQEHLVQLGTEVQNAKAMAGAPVSEPLSSSPSDAAAEQRPQ